MQLRVGLGPRCSRLSISSQNGQWPNFKGKAHNTAMVCKFLTWYLQSQPGFNSEEDMILKNSFVGRAGVQKVVHAPGPSLSQDQARKILHDGLQCLGSWSPLGQAHARRNQLRYQLKQKHYFWKMINSNISMIK